MCWNALGGRERTGIKRESRVAFSLTATTGAGKTVMAAAVIEALFDGDADCITSILTPER